MVINIFNICDFDLSTFFLYLRITIFKYNDNIILYDIHWHIAFLIHPI